MPRLVPDALIADRSAAQGGMPSDGVLTVVSNERKEDLAHTTSLPFFEAYFSNFIEGTEFSGECRTSTDWVERRVTSTRPGRRPP